MRDLQRDEHTLSLEASRRIGSRCKLAIEARVFGSKTRGPALNTLTDPSDRTAILDPDDYAQLEFTAYF